MRAVDAAGPALLDEPGFRGGGGGREHLVKLNQRYSAPVAVSWPISHIVLYHNELPDKCIVFGADFR